MTQLRLQAVYLLDGCCVTRLDSMDRVPPSPPDFTSQERALIWDGLERLAGEGRLKLIGQVKQELGRWHPAGLQRLTAYQGHSLTFRRTAEVIRWYRDIISRYPGVRPRPGLDPADAWLIVASKKFGYRIVTMELSVAQRSPRAKRGARIPDICAAEGLLVPFDLRELAVREDWLSTP